MPKACRKGRYGDAGKMLVYSPAEVAAVRHYWCGLEAEARLRLLRFDDAALVARLFGAQQALFFADFECFVHGIHNQDSVRRLAGVDMFDVQGVLDGDGDLTPSAFFAKRELVERADFFDFFARRLGRGFLQGAPALPRSEWLSLVQPAPTSWSQFGRQVLALAELAILEGQRSAAAAAATAPSTSTLVEEATLAASSGAKRRARHKRAALAAQVLGAAAEGPGDARRSPAACAGGGRWHAEDAQPTAARAEADGPWPARPPAGAAEGRTTRADVREHGHEHEHAAANSAKRRGQDQDVFSFAPICVIDESVISASQALRRSATEARIDAEVRARDARRSSEPPWLFADTYEGHCSSKVLHSKDNAVDGRSGFRSIFKNTFVQVVPTDADSESSGFSASEELASLLDGCSTPQMTTSIRVDDWYYDDPEPVLAAMQACRASAAAARIGAQVAPAMTAAQALRASAREARIAASAPGQRGRWPGQRGSAWPAWLLADGSSGEQWVDGFRTIVKNTFVDVEELMPACLDAGAGTTRAQSLPLLMSRSRFAGA